jgi:hypothetical protein
LILTLHERVLTAIWKMKVGRRGREKGCKPPSPPKKIHVFTNIKSVPRWSYSVSQHNKTYQSLLFGLTEYTHFSSTTIRDVKNIFLEYVVIIFLFGSTTDSSMIHADFIPLPTNYKNKKLLIITLYCGFAG